MPIRRRFLVIAFASSWLAAMSIPAQASQTDQAASFVQQAGNELVQTVNSTAPDPQKRGQLQAIVDRIVDADNVGRFCLGRFWRTATPQQQQQYITLFHSVLMNNVTAKLGEYKGVSFNMGRSEARDGNIVVSTVVNRPNNSPSNVQWVVSFSTGSPKIVDVIAEGTSLRLTQRSDYYSYLAHNNNDLNTLISAMRKQVGG